MKNARQIKAEKLLHYSERAPKNFIQFDYFINWGGDSDGLMSSDTDGGCLFSGNTVELMTGNVDVRLLVVPGTNISDVVRILDKFKARIQNNFGQIGNKEKETEQDDRPF